MSDRFYQPLTPNKIMENHTTDSTRKTLLKDVDELKRDAVQVAQDVKDHATAHVNQTKQQVVDKIQSVRDNFAEKPWTLIGIGFAVGLLVGVRLRR
jgi:ElaB/YqjD/DUF883 family membrane-anchored ribosome-binding protein